VAEEARRLRLIGLLCLRSVVVRGSPIALQVENLSKRYGMVEVVRGLSPRRAGVFGLLGPNGAGKTTTIGCLPHSAVLFGRRVCSNARVCHEPSAVRQMIGLAPWESPLPGVNGSGESAIFRPHLRSERCNSM
jgi:ABC-type Na+ transport system ATPase subunit NatA